MTKSIDPKQFGERINVRTLGTGNAFSDAPSLSFVKIRDIKSPPNQAMDISVDISGCNFRCAHCWVSNASLAANFKHSSIQGKINKLPKAFRHPRNNALSVAKYLYGRLKKRSSVYNGSGISLSGGEPLPYRGGIKTLAQYIHNQEEPFYVNLETTGFLIAQDETYLDAFDGLQDTLRFYISIKAMTAERFEQFTGVDGSHWEDAFIALERVLKRGFLATPGGIVLNIFEDLDKLNASDNEISKLHARLTQIHPDLPKAIAFHNIDFVNVQNRSELSKRMEKRGFAHTRKGFSGKIREAMTNYFNDAGTPIIMTDNTNKVKGAEYERSKTLLSSIISDLRPTTTYSL